MACRLVLVLCLCTLVVSYPLRAEAAIEVPLWEAGPGVAYLSIPEYRGSGKQQEYIFPIPYFVYRGEFLKVDRSGVKGIFYETQS